MWRIPLRTTAAISGVRADGSIRYNSETQKQQSDRHSFELKRVANNVYELPSTAQAIRYLHAACGFPAKSTWVKAIRKGNYVGWPFLTVEAVNKHFPESVWTPSCLKRHESPREHDPICPVAAKGALSQKWWLTSSWVW